MSLENGRMAVVLKPLVSDEWPVVVAVSSVKGDCMTAMIASSIDDVADKSRVPGRAKHPVPSRSVYWTEQAP